MSELHAIPAYVGYLPPDGDDLYAIITLGRGADVAKPHTGAGEVIDLQLRVRTPQVTQLLSVEQVAPARVDLTNARAAITDQVGEYPLGTLTDEPSRYLLHFGFEPQQIGDKIRVARVEIVEPSAATVLTEVNLVVEWSDDSKLIVVIDSDVATYTGQTELAEAIQSAIDALEDLDPDSATSALNKAARLADAIGDEARRFRLEDLIYQARHSSKTEVSRISSGAWRTEAGEPK